MFANVPPVSDDQANELWFSRVTVFGKKVKVSPSQISAVAGRVISGSSTKVRITESETESLSTPAIHGSIGFNVKVTVT